MKLRAITLVASLVLVSGAAAQERVGSISGVVKDQTSAAVAGASVALTNKVSLRTTTVTTNASGVYRAMSLEPGRYSIKVTHDGFAASEVPNVDLLLGRDLSVEVTLKVGGQEETVQVTGEAPLIDTRSTLRGHNLPAEEFEMMPKGRSFQDLASTSPSVNQGELEGGFQVNGASAGENNFTVDGVSVVSLVHGQQRQDAVFEHLQEVQVKTSGLAAEYGGAMGGVISAVTKSGGNEFHGSLVYYRGSSGLSSTNGLAKRIVLDPVSQNTAYYLQDDDASFSRNEFVAQLGGPIVKDKLFFFASASPRLEDRTVNYLIANGTQSAAVTRDRTSWSGFGKVTYEPTSRLRLNLSGLWTPDKATGMPAGYDGAAANWSTASATALASRQALGYEVPQWNGVFTADYSLSNSTLVSLRASYSKDNYFDTGVNTNQTYEYGSSSVGLAGVPSQYQLPAGSLNLPRTRINDHDLTTRKFVNLDLNKSFQAAGSHTAKVGFGYSRATNDVDLAYPNDGYVTVFWDQVFTSDATGKQGTGKYGYYTIDDQGTKGKTGANILSFYLQDSWLVTPRLTLNLGLRVEKEDIPSFRPDIAKVGISFGWGEKVAPRAGFAYDVFGDGKLKVAGMYGRYYDWTKYELARGSFGGDTWTTRYRTLDDPDPTKLSRAALTGTNLWTDEADSYKDHRIPSFGSDVVDPDMKPMAQDTFNLGFEFQIAPNTVFGVNAVRTNLLRTIEDIGTLVNGSETYIYGNPGEGLAKTAITTGATPPYEMPKAKRNYTALELTLNRRFSKNWFTGVSYTLSRLYGNYPGTVNTDEVAAPGRASVNSQSPFGTRTRPGSNATRAWDLDEMMFDSHGNMGVDGLLPTDRPHVFKVYGSYSFNFGTSVGANIIAESGTPVSKAVQSAYQYPILVEGRGSLGRTDFMSQTDLFVSHDIKLGDRRKVRLELNVLNLFNQKQVRHVFESVNRIGSNGRAVTSSALRLGGENLLNGYDYDALLAKTPDASKPSTSAASGFNDPRYLMGDLFNPGLAARFAIRFLF